MASTNDKLDFLYKKSLNIAFGSPPTGTTFGSNLTDPAAETSGFNRPRVFPYTQLFQQYIPSTAPTDLIKDTTFGSGANGTLSSLAGSTTAATSCGRYYSSAYPHIVKYIGIKLATAGTHSYYYSSPASSTSTNLLQNAIPTNYDIGSSTYAVAVYDSTGTSITSNSASYPWLFDPDVGYLTFVNNTDPSNLPPGITFWRYEGTIGYGDFYTPVTMSSTLSIAGNTTISGKLSLSSNSLYVNGTLFTGSSDTFANAVTMSSSLNVSGNVGFGTTNPVSKLHIVEATGTEGSAAYGTITLEHSNDAGKSSIVFRSKINGTSDYGYIRYRDDVDDSTSLERSRLEIGTENDGNSGTDTVHDSLILQKSGGYVGIATTSPAYNLDVTGTMRCTGQITGASFNATSDYRIKDDVLPLDSTFKLDLLRPVSYTNKLIKKQDIGFIAHEVQEIYPYLVNGEKDGDEYQSINYIGLLGVMVKELQDLKKENKEIKEELYWLKDKL